MTAITPEIIKEHGLKEDEYERIVRRLNREPNLTELGIFSVMWSEHCSYKSSRIWLKTLPTTGPHVIQGPGENAGVIDIGDGQAIVFKMESHNHPSFIEPYQGAATGVGGIMRDVFTMGARPIANLNALRFGAPDHPKTRHLVSGVVAGIGGYGNCMGIPTVGGETNFHPRYNGNILVNAMCVGLADADKIFYSAAKGGAGNPVVYVGSKTGRDGIHGATMASAEFDDQSEEKRPTVQVGDPFTEKLLLEACLELMAEDVIIAIQDMGAAGLTSSSVEMADKGGVGITLDLDKVPQRETGMTAYEMMLSESQERMLMVLRPGREDVGRKIFEKWGLDFAVIGETTETKNLVLIHKGETVADIPVDPLTDDAPLYERPWEPGTEPAPLPLSACPAPNDLGEALLTLVGSPDLASRAWIAEQYDSTVMGDTVATGGDAAIVRIHGTKKAVALTTDVTPRYCEAYPLMGGRQAVAEAWRNIVAAGGRPLAVTDNLNFGSPERPVIMGQIVECIKGIGEACKALDFPVVSGNVSLYNETNGQAILPTPAIGGVGIIESLDHAITMGLKQEGSALVLVGETTGVMGQSIYMREMHGNEDGAPPPVDLDTERRNGHSVSEAIMGGQVLAAHDLSDGGLLIALTEMALKGDKGFEITCAGDLPLHVFLFAEDQARYVLEMKPEDVSGFVTMSKEAGVPVQELGRVTGNSIVVNGQRLASLDDIRARHESWLPDLMAAEV